MEKRGGGLKIKGNEEKLEKNVAMEGGGRDRDRQRERDRERVRERGKKDTARDIKRD